MKRRNLTPQENAKNIVFNTELGIQHVILREPSIVDEFYFETTKAPHGTLESVSVVDPIIMLFNQERLDSMGSMAAKMFIDSLSQRSNSMQELRKQCSDEDLMNLIKSRHLQSPAEILSWCRYMKDNITEFNSEVQAYIESQKQSAIDGQLTIEPKIE